MMVDEEWDQEMYDAATLLGQDREECNVEYAFAAQAEVVLANGSPESCKTELPSDNR